MRRESVPPRPDWDATIRAQGLVYVDTELPDGGIMSYWDETAAYAFDLDEVLRLEAATEELHRMSVAAAEHVVAKRRYAEFGIPAWAADAVARSLREAPPTLYGRFDLAYDGSWPPKMLEYNADTPTALVEASIIQWYWLEQTRPGAGPVEQPAREAGRRLGQDRRWAARPPGARPLVERGGVGRGPHDRRLPRRDRPAGRPETSSCSPSRTSAGTAGASSTPTTAR